jgi:hypothetical protein
MGSIPDQRLNMTNFTKKLDEALQEPQPSPESGGDIGHIKITKKVKYVDEMTQIWYCGLGFPDGSHAEGLAPIRGGRGKGYKRLISNTTEYDDDDMLDLMGDADSACPGGQGSYWGEFDFASGEFINVELDTDGDGDNYDYDELDDNDPYLEP